MSFKKHFTILISVLVFTSGLCHSQAPSVPDFMVFAGDTVRFDDFQRYSRMDRELLTFSYMHSTSTLMLKRAGLYFPIVEPVLKKYGLPDDLKYLMVIESNLDPTSISKVGAAGLWQFMAPSARQYGLEVNSNVDERYNVEKSTDSACRYLHDLYNRYHDWMSVAAAYNAGPGAISQQLSKQGGRNSLDLWLNQETSRYMYRMMAAKLLFQNPSSFGFEVNDNNSYHYVRPREIIKVSDPIDDLVSFASRHGVSYSELKGANLWLRENSLKNSIHKAYYISIPSAVGRPDYYDWHHNVLSSTVGLGISFYTDSPEIVVSAVSTGIRLFVCRQNGETEELEFPYTGLEYNNRHDMGNRYSLYIPDLDPDDEFEVGVKSGSKFKWAPSTMEKPIAVCGTRDFASEVEILSDSPVVIVSSDFSDGSTILVNESDFKDGLDADKLNRMLGREVNHLFQPVRQRREPDSYEWEDRHEKILFRNKASKPQIVLIGDSITHFWAGEPIGHRRSGVDAWTDLFSEYAVTNMGFGWDRIENVYWRLFHGELDTCSPEHIFLFIGTNNLEKNTNEEIVDGICGLSRLLSSKLPDSKIHVVGIYPRYGGEDRVKELNMLLDKKLVRSTYVDYLDYGHRFLMEDGKIESSLFLDGLHPNEKGYSIIAEELSKLLK